MQDTTFLTTLFAVAGGTTKALMSGFTLLSVNLENLIEVAIYAFVSATVGYGVKLFYDYLRRSNNPKNPQ